MSRKNNKYLWFIVVWVMIFLSCGQGDGSAHIVMKISHNGSEEHAFQTGYESIKRSLDSVSGGGVDFQMFPASQIAGEKEAIEMIKLGVIASTPASSGALGAFVPEAGLFNFPFIFRDLDHFYSVLDGPIGNRISKKIEDKLDCIVLGWWFAGIRNTWNSKRPITKPEDLKGLKIRVIGSSIVLDAFDAFGAQATNMSFGELYSAVQQGVLDGGECDNTDLYVEKFYEITKYVSNTEHLFLAVALLFSKKQYDKLSPELQKALVGAGQKSVHIQRMAMEQKTKEAFRALESKGLIFNDVDKDPFRELVKEVYKDNAEKVGGMQLIEQVIDQ